MTKEEVELIIFKISANGQDAINMKFYKNGTICRYGVGGLPQLGIAVMSFVYDTRYFLPLIEKVPDEILNQPLNYEEQTPNGYLEYVIAFTVSLKMGIMGKEQSGLNRLGLELR